MGGSEDFALCSATFFLPSHWRERVLTSGPAAESLIRRFNQVSPNFDPSFGIKGPPVQQIHGVWPLASQVWLKVLAFGLHLRCPLSSREKLGCYVCVQRGLMFACSGSDVKGAFVAASGRGSGDLTPTTIARRSGSGRSRVWEVWGTGKCSLVVPPRPWQQRGLSGATRPPVWLPLSLTTSCLHRVIWAPSSFHSRGLWGLVIVGSCFSLFLKLTPGRLEGQ